MNPRDEIDRLIRHKEREIITSFEFYNRVLEHLWKLPPQEKLELLAGLANHPNLSVRKEALELQVFVRHEEMSKDFDYIRRTSPLQPGIRLRLFGGYDSYSSHGRPWWLNGRECYKGTFVAFAQRGVNTVPVACVELDDEIDMQEGSGQRHKGRFALLLSSYSSSSVAWTAEGTVTVHVVNAFPDDYAAFFLSHPFATEIETHAQYEIIPLLSTIAKEIAKALNDLDARADAQSAGYAAWCLQRLLADAPALRPTVIPALIQKLHHSGYATPAAARGLLRDLGRPALRSLADTLSCKDSWLRGQVAYAIGSFGPEAKETLPELEKLLHGDLHVRVLAAIAIWRIDGRTPEMARIVLEGLQDYGVANEAATCLREMGPDAAEVVPALVEILSSGKVPSWRAQASVALGGMGLEAARAIPALIEATEDLNEDVSGSAFGALRELRALARVGELILREFEGGPNQPLQPTGPA